MVRLIVPLRVFTRVILHGLGACATHEMKDKTFYKQYLKSRRWQAKRELWFATFGRYCRACGTTAGQIQLHHLTYDRLGNERLSDMVALCAECHRGAEKLHRLAGGKGDRRAATAAFIIQKRKSNGRRR